VHGLIACGGEDGALECFDLRQKAPVGRINAVAPTGNSDQEVTSLRFDESEGLLLAAGTSAGQVLHFSFAFQD
jgi:ribosome biogenesis protein ENP2